MPYCRNCAHVQVSGVPRPRIVTVRSLQEKHGSIPARSIGTSASLCPGASDEHRRPVAHAGCSHLHALGVGAAVTPHVVEQLAARCFDAADRLTRRDSGLHLRRDVAGRHVIQNLPDDTVAFVELFHPDDELRGQIAAMIDAPSEPETPYNPRKGCRRARRAGRQRHGRSVPRRQGSRPVRWTSGRRRVSARAASRPW